MAGRQNHMHTTTITINGVQVTLSANTPEELGQQIVALQRPGTAHRPTTSRARLVSDLRPPTRTHQDYQATQRVPIEEQDCRYGTRCNNTSCPRKHPVEERSRTSSTSSTAAATAGPEETSTKPPRACKFGKNCKNKDTTCKFCHDKPCKTFTETGKCPYGANCKFLH